MTYSLSKKSANLPLIEVNNKLLDQKGREQVFLVHSKNSIKRGNEGPPIG